MYLYLQYRRIGWQMKSEVMTYLLYLYHYIKKHLLQTSSGLHIWTGQWPNNWKYVRIQVKCLQKELREF